MIEEYHIGDRVQVHLDSAYWKSRGWFEGTIRRIDPYSQHRSFYWVELDQEIELAQGGRTRLISVFNPKGLRKI